MARRIDGGVPLPEWPSGTTVKGKWTGTVMLIERRLGTGANGAVYLARTLQGPVALKVCRTAGEAALEWGLLDRLRSVGVPFPRPVVIDDEAATGAYFYAMEWVLGEPLDHALPRLDRNGMRTVLAQTATALAALHRTGHVFGDIKPQNILVQTRPPEARLIDVGGVTPIGRSVRQFTPFYDRAFWDLGSRRADAHYDVCGLALAVVLAYAGSPPAGLTNQDPAVRRRWLQRALTRVPWQDVASLLHSALTDSTVRAEDLARGFITLPDVPPRAARRWGKTGRAATAIGTASAGGANAGRPAPPQTGSPRTSGHGTSSGLTAAGMTHAGQPAGRGSAAAAGAGRAHGGIGGRTAAPGGTAGLGPGARAAHAARNASAASRMDWTERLMWFSLSVAAATTTLAWLAVTGWF